MSVINAIGDVLAQVIAWFYGLTGSYGVAIILLTVAIKIAMHPLTRKQLRSTRAMQALAPQMAVLREKYKDDPKTMQAETMNLYRTNGVNPFGGCLPMLAQLPVFYGLFAVLRRRNAFVAPGAVATATFLGLPLDRIPGVGSVLQEPLLLAIPLLVGSTMYWQQHISITDPQQAKMMMFMPVIIAWSSLLFPFALSIYWIVSTLISVGEYYLVVGRAQPVPVLGGVANRESGPAVLSQRPKGTKKR